MCESCLNREMKQILLTVIIPVYNSEAFISECLDSVFNQQIDKREYEVICIDDGSTDSSNAILTDYESKNQNLKVVHQNNLGVSAARNVGINLAMGKYIWFVDSDDYVVKDAFSALRIVLEEGIYDRVLFCSYNTLISYSDYSLNNNGLSNLKSRVFKASVWSCVYLRKTIVNSPVRFREGIIAGEDTLFNYELESYGISHKQLDTPLYVYRINYSSCTHQKNIRSLLDAHIVCVEVVKQYYIHEKNKRTKTIRYLHTEIEYILNSISKFPVDERIDYLKKIAAINPYPYAIAKTNGVIISIYSNLHSINLAFVSKISIYFPTRWIIQAWAKGYNSKMRKRIERFFKKKLSDD